MKTSYQRLMLNGVNQLLHLGRLELVRKNREFLDYIPLEETLSNAEKSGLSLGDYIDQKFNIPGATQLTIDKMSQMGVFSNDIKTVCEIGPGSGRFLEKVITICKPEHYEIYETSRSWQEWLVKKYKVTPQSTDGVSLSSTASNSIDLVHSHKVLYGNPILTICRYLIEIARVVKHDGYAVFDLMTEDCLPKDVLESWLASGIQHICSMTAKQFGIDLMASYGLVYVGGFFIPMRPGMVEYFVFKKQA